MKFDKAISKAMKTVGKVVQNAEKDLVITQLRSNPDYDPTTGEFSYVNPKTYRCKGIVVGRNEVEEDQQRQQRDQFTVLIAYEALPIELNTSDKINFDGQDHMITATRVDPSLALHRVTVRAA